MILNFSDLYNEKTVTNSAVLFIAGQTQLFNRIMADKVKEDCKGSQEKIDLSDFGDLVDTEVDEASDLLSFEQYMTYCNTSRVNGKWYCSVDFHYMNAKDKKQLLEHLKKPATFGRLVVYVSDYRDKKDLLKNRTIINSSSVNLIKLDYPKRDTLNQLVISEFEKRGTELTPDALGVFILRMGTYYDRYSETIDRLCVGHNKLTYADMREGLKGVTSYVMWDLLKTLPHTYGSDKSRSVKTRKAYKVLKDLIVELGERKTLSMLKKQVDYLVEFRYIINTGVLPIVIPYKVDKVQEKLSEDSPLKTMAEPTFKRYANLANQTTLKDWLYIQMIINHAMEQSTSLAAFQGLSAVINRSTYPNERVLNDLGVKNILTEGLVDLNKLPYMEV